MGHYGVITAYRNAGQNCKTKSGKNSGEKLTLNFDNNLSLNKASPRCLLALNQVLTHLYLDHPRASCSTNSTPRLAIEQMSKGLRFISCIAIYVTSLPPCVPSFFSLLRVGVGKRDNHFLHLSHSLPPFLPFVLRLRLFLIDGRRSEQTLRAHGSEEPNYMVALFQSLQKKRAPWPRGLVSAVSIPQN